MATIEDLAYRLYDPELNHLKLKSAVDYLRDVGVTGTRQQLMWFAIGHRRHIDKFLAAGAAVAPAQIEEGITKIPPPRGDVTWVDLNKSGMSVGADALRLIAARLPTMEDNHLIAVAKIGQAAASKRADLEMKGALKRAESIARLAAGMSKPAEAT